VFTGLVEDVGRLLSRTPRGPGARLRVATRLSPLVLGESIAVMGVCLTVEKILDGAFEADASSETVSRSTLGRLPTGHRLHLERAVPVGGRLGGHIVSGHVDGLGRLVERKPLGEAIDLTFAYDASLAAFLAEKGSIAVDGVSLTINAVERDRFHVAVIPHTQDETLLADMTVGTYANLEVDVLARYVARWLQVGRQSDAGEQGGSSSDDTLMSRLASSGYL
jgi:riboflavin synthase